MPRTRPEIGLNNAPATPASATAPISASSGGRPSPDGPSAPGTSVPARNA